MPITYIDDPEEYDPSWRPVTVAPPDRYNLQNQSWGIPRKDKNGVLRDPVDIYQSALSQYPSNSEVVWSGLQFQPVTGSADPYERIYPNLYEDALGADTKAAKGYFVIDVLRRGQSRAEAYNANKTKYPQMNSPALAIPTDLTSGGAKIVQQYAGRVFYAGFNGNVTDGDIRSPNLSNFIFFTQLVRNKKDFVKCHQEGDPTSRDNSDVIDTDGGFIKLSSAEGILGMVNLGSHLVVIASNGVWGISGGSDFGFSATNYKAEKISSFGGISALSIIEEAGRAFFWGEDGIYVIAKDQFGALVVQSLSEKTIQTFYQNIPNTVKQHASGTYDVSNKTIRWIYKEGTPFTSESVTKELLFNTSLNAFYPNRIYNPTGNNGEIVSSFSSIKFASTEEFTNVIVDGEIAVVGSDVVVTGIEFESSTVQSSRYLAFVNTNGSLSFTFGYYRDTNFEDWPEIGASDAFAYLITGTQTGGDSSISKQIPYLTMHMERTENGFSNGIPINQSSCLIRSRWDFSDTSSSNKWSPLFQAYRYRKAYIPVDDSDPYDYGFNVLTTKNKLRGRGRAFSLYMETEPRKDCRIIGWNLAINGNQYT
jgi:hypothetical protein